jgi:hypothetical protein
MKICDKCKKSNKLSNIKLKDKSFDLCDNCINELIKSIKGKKDKTDPLSNFMKNMSR